MVGFEIRYGNPAELPAPASKAGEQPGGYGKGGHGDGKSFRRPDEARTPLMFPIQQWGQSNLQKWQARSQRAASKGSEPAGPSRPSTTIGRCGGRPDAQLHKLLADSRTTRVNHALCVSG